MKRYLYHLVDRSPWPLISSMGALIWKDYTRLIDEHIYIYRSDKPYVRYIFYFGIIYILFLVAVLFIKLLLSNINSDCHNFNYLMVSDSGEQANINDSNNMIYNKMKSTVTEKGDINYPSLIFYISVGIFIGWFIWPIIIEYLYIRVSQRQIEEVIDMDKQCTYRQTFWGMIDQQEEA